MTRDRLWTWLAVLLPAFAATIAPMETVDLAYQVRAGDLMLSAGRILTADPFTFTAAGQPWLNQQWGAGIVLAAVHDAAGWGGLAILRTVLIALIVGGVYLACRQEPRANGADVAGEPPSGRVPGSRLAAVLALAGFLVAIGSLALRAQLFGVACFAISLLLVARRGRNPRAVWLVPPLMLVWVNVHGSFFLGPAMLAAAAIDDVQSHRPSWRHTALAAVVAALATGATPFGFDVWRYAIGLTTNPNVADRVSEWQRTSPFSGLGVVYYGSVLLVGALGIAAWRRGWRPGIGTLGWLAGLAAIGAYAERGVVWWALGAPVAIAPAAALVFSRAPGGGSRRAEPEPRGLQRLNAAVALLLVAAVVILQPIVRPGGDPLSGPPGTLRDAPAGLARALGRLAGPSDRAVISQAWASWFEWAAPGIPVMVDSRIEVEPATAWTDYLAIVHGGPDALATLARIGATVVVVDPKEIAAIGTTLAASGSGWRQAYADADGSIYLRAP